MTTSCPKCGKPVHAGAKFCGNCGSPIPAAPSAPPSAPAMSSPGGPVCPNCKKPVTPTAKFCRNCGQALTPQPVQTPAVPAPAVPTGPALPSPVAPPVPQRPPGSIPVPPRPARQEGLGKFRIRKLSRSTLLIGGIILVVLCLAALAISMVVFQEKLFPPKNTPTATQALVSTATSEPVTGAATVAPVPDATSAPATAETLKPSPTVKPGSGTYSEAFDSGWQDRWNLWGTTLPTENGANPGLMLNGQAGADDSGATSQKMFSLDGGNTIQFDARVDANQRVFFDWDPSIIRKPGDQAGAIHLAIGNGQVVFQITRVGNVVVECPAIPLNDTNNHTYKIVISPKYVPTLFMDADKQCKDLNDRILLEDNHLGRISFSGQGIISNLTVLHP